MSPIKMSFQRKKVSKNAILTFVIGIGTLAGFGVLLLIAFFTGGKLPYIGGLIGCLLGLLALFGVLWGIVCFDDVRTTQQYKVSGIILNVLAVLLAISFILI